MTGSRSERPAHLVRGGGVLDAHPTRTAVRAHVGSVQLSRTLERGPVRPDPAARDAITHGLRNDVLTPLARIHCRPLSRPKRPGKSLNRCNSFVPRFDERLLFGSDAQARDLYRPGVVDLKRPTPACLRQPDIDRHLVPVVLKAGIGHVSASAVGSHSMKERRP